MSLGDVFEDHPQANEYRPKVFDVIKLCPWIDFQVLTKRPERILANLPKDWNSGWKNVWLGTSVEDMRVAKRVDELRKVPATVRFISYEPALGPLDDLDISGIDWIIYGGESGPGYRAHDLAWPRAMEQKCLEQDVAFWFKQSSGIRTEMGTELDGRTIHEWPVQRLPVACGISQREYERQERLRIEGPVGSLGI